MVYQFLVDDKGILACDFSQIFAELKIFFYESAQ